MGKALMRINTRRVLTQSSHRSTP